MKRIPFVDLVKNYKDLEHELNKALKKVFLQGNFILGKEVGLFEKEFASYTGAKYGIGVASGTDAIAISLTCLGIGRGDEVVVPANSYPTAFAVAASGARLVLIDVDPLNYGINPDLIEKSITKKTKALIVVHLYGQPAEMDKIVSIAKKYNIFLIEDCAQAHGAKYKGKKVGTFGDFGCFSFYPTKNLGTFGDGGMVITSNTLYKRRIKMLRMYGETSRYKSKMLGVNSRLDELHAAILRLKLKKLEVYNKKRRRIAARYIKSLQKLPIILPSLETIQDHVYYLFVIRTKKRNELMRFLQKRGIETAIHFPFPIHLVESFSYLGYKKGEFPVVEEAAREILSLPCFPELKLADVGYICANIKQFFRNHEFVRS